MNRPRSRYQPGDRIADRYQVHQALMGGMGEVYLCLDLEQMLPYALKTFQQRYQSDALKAAFETEVATWIALEKHPNIVRCFHMDTLDNQPFMILEWVSGEEGLGADLRSHLRYGSLPLNQTLKIILDICYGLQHAQDKQPGLVHRDLKPENILIAQGGQAKITDYGLAQIVSASELMPDSDALLTNTSQTVTSHKGIAGTPSYMAPEQWRGERLDERTDIYALACIWVELLTGQTLFSLGYWPTNPQEHKRWLSEMQYQHEQAKRIDLVADIPVVINDLIQACLDQDLAERPDSLIQLIDHVQALYKSLIGQPPPPPSSPGEMTTVDYNNRGITYRALGQFDKAFLDFNQAISLDPSLAKAYSNRGATYQDLGQFDKALANFSKAITLDPSDADAYYNRGAAYQRLSQLNSALTDYNQAITLDPNLTLAYSNRGATYRDLGQFDKAFLDFNQAISLDPSLALAYFGRGLTYKALGQFDYALADYNKAISLNSTYTLAYSNRGIIYHALGQFDKAFLDFNQAISLDPSLALAYVNLGSLFANQGKLEEALPYLEKAAQLGEPTAAQYAAKARQMLGQTPKSEINAVVEAFGAFTKSASLDEMRQVVIDHPSLIEAKSMEAIARAITEQIPAEHQPTYQQRLTWLRQIIQEQAQ